MNRVAVVINELGEVGIDHDLVSVQTENMTLLANGCVCCSVRTDLQETLRELFAQRRTGAVFDFDRVIVETTGLADPAPVVQIFALDTLIGGHYRLDGVVTLVDGVNGADTLDRQPEAVKQAAIADRLLVTKGDLAGPAALESLHERLRELNPQAELRDIVMGEVEPAFLLDIGLRNARTDAPSLARFLGIGAGEAAGTGPDANDTDRPAAYLGSRLPAAHDRSIRTFVLRFETPFTWPVFTAAMELLTSLRGPDLLRVKGIVNVDGDPVVVQGVQHVFHPPAPLAAWPSDDHGSRLVFITRKLEPAAVRALIEAANALGPTGEPG
jgi:G3E family GTPase